MRRKPHSNRHKRLRQVARKAAPIANAQIRAKGIELPADESVRVYSEHNQRQLLGRQLLGGFFWVPWKSFTRTLKLELPMFRIIQNRLKRMRVWQ